MDSCGTLHHNDASFFHHNALSRFKGFNDALEDALHCHKSLFISDADLRGETIQVSVSHVVRPTISHGSPICGYVH